MSIPASMFPSIFLGVIWWRSPFGLPIAAVTVIEHIDEHYAAWVKDATLGLWNDDSVHAVVIEALAEEAGAEKCEVTLVDSDKRYSLFKYKFWLPGDPLDTISYKLIEKK